MRVPSETERAMRRAAHPFPWPEGGRRKGLPAGAGEAAKCAACRRVARQGKGCGPRTLRQPWGALGWAAHGLDFLHVADAAAGEGAAFVALGRCDSAAALLALMAGAAGEEPAAQARARIRALILLHVRACAAAGEG